MTSPAGAHGGGDGGQQSGGDGGEAQAQNGLDAGAITEQMQTLTQGFEGMREFLQSQPWQQQADDGAGEQPESQTQPIDPSTLQEFTYGDEEAARQLASAFEQEMSRREAAMRQEFQRELGNVRETVSERERIEQMRDLVEENGNFQDREFAEQIVGQAHALVEANGWPTEMANDPRMWRMVAAAQETFARAEEEGRENPQAAHLEGGQGGAGAAAQRGDDLANSIIQSSGGGRSVLPF